MKKSVILIKSYIRVIQLKFAFKMAYPHKFLAENYLMVDENDSARFKLLDRIPVIYKEIPEKMTFNREKILRKNKLIG